jgi:hypothetical protein
MRTIGLVGTRARDTIPASHRDLAECPPVAALSTIGADGYPQTSVVWCDSDGECFGSTRCALMPRSGTKRMTLDAIHD